MIDLCFTLQHLGAFQAWCKVTKKKNLCQPKSSMTQTGLFLQQCHGTSKAQPNCKFSGVAASKSGLHTPLVLLQVNDNTSAKASLGFLIKI